MGKCVPGVINIWPSPVPCSSSPAFIIAYAEASFKRVKVRVGVVVGGLYGRRQPPSQCDEPGNAPVVIVPLRAWIWGLRLSVVLYQS